MTTNTSNQQNKLTIKNITFDEYLVAIDKWEDSISNFNFLKEIIKLDYVFS